MVHMEDTDDVLLKKHAVNCMNVVPRLIPSEQFINIPYSSLTSYLQVLARKQFEEIFLMKSMFEGRISKLHLLHSILSIAAAILKGKF